MPFAIYKKANLNSIHSGYIGTHTAVFCLHPLSRKRADRSSLTEIGLTHNASVRFTNPRCPQNSSTHRHHCPTMSIQTTQNIKFHTRRPKTRPHMLNTCLEESLLPTLPVALSEPPASQQFVSVTCLPHGAPCILILSRLLSVQLTHILHFVLICILVVLYCFVMCVCMCVFCNVCVCVCVRARVF
jgi:hypothetical protein